MSKRSRRRTRPIRTKIVALLLVPLISLMALWMFAARVTLADTLILLDVQTLGDYAFTGEELLVALQTERKASLIYVGKGGEGNDRAEMDALRAETDERLSAFLRQSTDESIVGKAKPKTRRLIEVSMRRLEALESARDAIDADQAEVVTTLKAYGRLTMPLARMPGSMSDGVGQPQIANEINTLGAMLVAREILAREYSLLSGALADGQLTESEYTRFVQLVGMSRYVYEQVLPDMRPEDQRRYRQIAASSASDRVSTMEGQVIAIGAGGGKAPVDYSDWRAASSEVMGDLVTMGKISGQGTIDRTLPIILLVLLRLALAGVVGLVAVILSLVLSVRVGRSIVRELTGLREAARELAEDRLPRAVERLHSGGPDTDVEEDARVRLPTFRTREIAHVGEAFTAVQRTAVDEAVNEAKMRAGIRQVFVNLARRSQALLNRQLKLLDGMQRRTEDPDALEELFRLDHLATRMQRHAEGLIILSGSAPGRRWRDPVPMIDVVRAAVSEVEGYSRAEVLPVAPHDVSLAGPVIADVVHLLAEVIENATLYSPPTTEVRVYPHAVSNGFVVEVEDRGLGMSPEDLAAANERLANPPEFDPSESARLGLFVVGQLAKRHGIAVSLRGSPFGGTTAIVLLPHELIVDETTVAGQPAGAVGEHDGSDGNARHRPDDAEQQQWESEPAGVAAGPVAVDSPSGLPRRVRGASHRDPRRGDGI